MNKGKQPAATPSDASDCDEDYDEDCDEIEDEGSVDGDVEEIGKDKRVIALTKEQLLLCSATLKGYALKNKKWCMVPNLLLRNRVNLN